VNAAIGDDNIVFFKVFVSSFKKENKEVSDSVVRMV
jgi:hypothetical protein